METFARIISTDQREITIEITRSLPSTVYLRIGLDPDSSIALTNVDAYELGQKLISASQLRPQVESVLYVGSKRGLKDGPLAYIFLVKQISAPGTLRFASRRQAKACLHTFIIQFAPTKRGDRITTPNE
jgi:hypothetical protein